MTLVNSPQTLGGPSTSQHSMQIKVNQYKLGACIGLWVGKVVQNPTPHSQTLPKLVRRGLLNVFKNIIQ